MIIGLCLHRHTERAGERAARVLPAAFDVAETCIEALAIDTGRAEAADEEAKVEDRGIDTMLVLSDRQANPPAKL